MHRKLFVYMLAFAGLLLIYVLIAMVLFGQFKNVKKSYKKSLDIHLSILDKEITDYFDNAAIYAVYLSQASSEILEKILGRKNITFSELKDNKELLVQTQDMLFDTLRNSIFNADVSGAFVVLNTTINSKVKDSQNNRSGLYLQLDTRSIRESSVLVYRGDAQLGKRHDAMPHRKWRLEYQISNIPEFSHLLEQNSMPISETYTMTSVFELPGTTQKVMLLTVPIIGKNGAVYGICGFEIDQMYYKEKFSQPSNLSRLSCLFVPVADKHIDTFESLSSGVKDGYYYVPNEKLTVEDFGSGLKRFVGQGSDYIGALKKISLVKNEEDSLLVAMIPKSDYDRDKLTNTIEIATSVILFLFFAIAVSLMFSRRYITPITKSLSAIKNEYKILDENYDIETNKSGFDEIDEFVNIVIKKLQEKSDDGLPKYLSDEFNRFIESTSDLTPAETNVLSLIIQGCSVKELPERLFISESTAKHHMLKIYKKLGVSSRGELLLYIEMLKGCGMIDRIASENSNEKI